MLPNSTYSMLPKIYTQYIYVYIHPYMLGNMYMYWVYVLGNINIYWIYVLRNLHIYWGYVLGIVNMYWVRLSNIYVQYIFDVTQYIYPIHIIVVHYIWTSVLQDIYVPQYIWKYVLGICLGSHLYILDYMIYIGYISWVTFVLPNTYKKVLSNIYGALPKTYTQYIFHVPNIYLGKNLGKNTYVLDNNIYVSQVSIEA